MPPRVKNACKALDVTKPWEKLQENIDDLKECFEEIVKDTNGENLINDRRDMAAQLLWAKNGLATNFRNKLQGLYQVINKLIAESSCY